MFQKLGVLQLDELIKLSKAEIVKLVRAGIAKLNDKDKQLILLCDLEGLPHKEVGQILNYSTETITVKLYRARRRLEARWSSVWSRTKRSQSGSCILPHVVMSEELVGS